MSWPLLWQIILCGFMSPWPHSPANLSSGDLLKPPVHILWEQEPDTVCVLPCLASRGHREETQRPATHSHTVSVCGAPLSTQRSLIHSSIFIYRISDFTDLKGVTFSPWQRKRNPHRLAEALEDTLGRWWAVLQPQSEVNRQIFRKHWLWGSRKVWKLKGVNPCYYINIM